MANPLYKNNPGLRFLLHYWSRYCELQPWHIDWARRYIQVLPLLRKHQTLYLEGEKQKYVYLVVQGLLARVTMDPDSGKRKILSVALPGMALMTTPHLYSSTPSTGDIVVLRPKTTVVQIPYRAILEFKEQEPHIDTLIDILSNKKKKQMTVSSRILHERDPFTRYLLFAKDMPEIHRILMHGETAEILGISLSSAQRYYKYWLNS